MSRLLPEPDFSGCIARLDWASEALDALYLESGQWFREHGPYSSYGVEYHPEANIHSFRLTGEPPPPRLWILAGNIVHQIRASLDNLVWQLVYATKREPSGGPQGNAFPIFTRQHPKQGFADRTKNTLRGVHPDHVALIERLQPYLSPSGRDPVRQHPLGVLAHLSNRDKHQVVQIVAATLHSSADWAVRFGGHFQTLAAGLVNAGDLHPGAVVAWAEFAPEGFHPDVHMEVLAHMCLLIRDPPNPDGPEMRLQIEGELRFILSNVRAVVDSFLPIAAGGEAEAVSFEIEALSARYQAHFRASPSYPGTDEIPPWF